MLPASNVKSTLLFNNVDLLFQQRIVIQDW